MDLHLALVRATLSVTELDDSESLHVDIGVPTNRGSRVFSIKSLI